MFSYCMTRNLINNYESALFICWIKENIYLGPYIYDIHEKYPIFAPHPSPFFLSGQMGLNRGRPHCPWTSKLRLPTTSTPILFGNSCSILIIFSRCLHHIPCPCNSQLFTIKNRFKLNSTFCSKTQANTSHLEC